MSAPEEAPLRAALIERLRFEHALGVETVRPQPLAPPPAPAAAEPHQAVPAPDLPPEGAPSVPAALADAPATLSATDPSATPSAAVPTSTPSPIGTGLFAIEGEIAALSPEQKAERWKALEARALACTRCPLHQGRNKVVFGEGDRAARLVFVGEGPGADEDRTGRPFVGRAGQLLDRIITAMGLRREDVYICNVVKCRPPENRTPTDEEAHLCWPYLEEQLALLAPKAIVTLGAPATKALLKTTQGITTLRGHWRLYHGMRVMPTFHPAFVLRSYTPAIRGQVWSDMQQVMEFLNQ